MRGVRNGVAGRSERRASRALALVGLVVLFGLTGCSDDNHPVAVVDTVPPAAPQALYSVTGDTQVKLYWVRNTEPDLAGYRVYRGPAYDGPYTPISTLNGGATTTFVDQALGNGVTYYYAVSAYDAAGNEGDLSIENVNDTPRPAGTGVTLAPKSAEPAAAAGFDFSGPVRRLSGDPQTDIYFEVNGGTRLAVAPYLNPTNVTDIQDAGFIDMDSADFSPTDGWSPTGTVELIVGHTYYVWTRTSNYAKFRVTALSDVEVRFDWAYQLVPDNTQLAKQHPRAALAEK